LGLGLLTAPGSSGRLLAQPAPAAGQATPAEFYQDFRGRRPPRPPLRLAGPDADILVIPEEGGLHITLPANRPPDQRREAVGLQLNTGLTGDFEVTGTYELLSAEEPSQGYGVGVNLMLTTGPELRRMAKVGRFRHPTRGSCYLADFSVKGSPKDLKARDMPTSARTGKLRMVREGPVVRFLVDDDDTLGFHELLQADFGDEPVGIVRFVVNTGTSTAAVDARLVDLKVRYSSLAAEAEPLAGAAAEPVAPPVAKSGGTGWLAVPALAGLVIALTLGVWLYLRQSGRAARVPARAPTPVACPGCGKGLKVKAELAGKKVKCPQCGQGVPIPHAGAGEPGAASR
jgi:hypothetical protein